jgi:hypothetical protein
MAQLPMRGMTRQQAINAIEEAYNLPVTLYYLDEAIPLIPEVVDLSLDVEATAANLDEVLTQQSSFQGFVNYALNQLLGREAQTLEITPVFDYSRERLDAFLARIAQKYDHEPLRPVFLAEEGAFRAPQPGTKLDIEASRPLVIEALLSAVNREAALVVAVTPAPESTLNVLRQAIEVNLADFNSIPGIFIKDLKTGQEMCLNCNLAFTGLSTLKLAIAGERCHATTLVTDPEMALLVHRMLTETQNSTANLLLAQIGTGNAYAGARQVSDFINNLALVNTFISAPYDLQDDIEHLKRSTPANTRTDITTHPSPYIQTTPLESGLLLEGIYQCTRGGGLLRMLYPQQITPDECEDVLHWLETERASVPLVNGIAADVRIVHQTTVYRPDEASGRPMGGGTFVNQAVIYSPNTDIIITAYLYHPTWTRWEESAPAFETVGQLAYQYFNPD